MRISVVIPTFNRAEILQQALWLWNQQDFAKNNYEVIVVDDGSNDATSSIVQEMIAKVDYELRYYFQKNSGQGVARNLGIEKARGEIIVFSQDDIWVGPQFLDYHNQTHLDFPAPNVGVLGLIEWHPDLDVSDFMRWLTNGSSIFGKFGGHQFAFEKLKSKEWADYNFFYTSNISLKKEILQLERFDTDFKSYGWEDIELGYRLDQKYSLRLRFVPEAIAWHYHQIDFASFRKRMFAIGRAAYVFDRKHPELAKVPNWKKALAFRILGNKAMIGSLGLLAKVMPRFKALYFYALSKRYFMEGIDAGGVDLEN